MTGANRKISVNAGRDIFRTGNKIIIKQSLSENNEIIISCSDLPWYGNFPLAIKALINSGQKKIRFLVLDEEKFSTTEMEVINLGIENGLIKIKVTIPGFASLFWSVLFYADSNGSIIKYIGNNGPGTPKVCQFYSKL